MKKEEPNVMTLPKLHDGAAVEMFQDALTSVLKNIEDLNTDHKSKREIRLTFQFAANEERNVSDVMIQCGTKLAGMKGVQSLVYIGKHKGETIAVEQPRQDEMFPQPKGKMDPASPFGKTDE